VLQHRPRHLFELQACSLLFMRRGPVLDPPAWMVSLGVKQTTTHGIRNGYTLCGIEATSREWTEALSVTAQRCKTCDKIPPECATSGDLMAVGLTYRQVDYWCQHRYLRPMQAHPGYGQFRLFPEGELVVAALMAQYVAAGIVPAVAHRAARNGGQLAPGVRIVVEEAA
jgi:hypothetical protein